MECLLPYFNMVAVPHKIIGLGRMSDYRGFTVRMCAYVYMDVHTHP